MDDFLLHLEKKTATLIADSECTQPGKSVNLDGGGNRLSVTSTGNKTDERQLRVNDTEIVLETTLQSYVQDYLNEEGGGPVTMESSSARFIGQGNIASPLEAVAKINSASVDTNGVVKVVHEGSHGFPCPGFSSSSVGFAFDLNTNVGIMLRNGADDLEQDVFISHVTIDEDAKSITYTPTADRFRIPALPPTAKPTRVEHSSDGVILLQTTDGPFFIFTNNNIDISKWKACKIANQELFSLRWSYFPIYISGTVYLVKTTFDTTLGAFVELYKSSYTNQTVLQLTKITLSGTNFSGSPQSTSQFKLFNVVYGDIASKPLVANPSKDLRSLSVTRLKSSYWNLEGDCYDFCVSGNRVRVLHRNAINGYSADTSDIFIDNCHVSYVLDLVNGTVTPDNPSRYPAIVSKAGSSIVDTQLAGGMSADWDNRIVRIGKHTLCYNTYTRLAFPNIVLAKNISNKSNFDNLLAGSGQWDIEAQTAAPGLYGSVLKMNCTGIMPIGDDCIILRDSTGTKLKVKYDPYGSYSPILPGYGPTNDRVIIEHATYTKLRNMCWIYDGEKSKVAGGRLHEQNLTSPTTYNDGVFGNPVSIDIVDFNRMIDNVVSAIPNAHANIIDRRLVLDVFSERDLPVIAALSITTPHPNTPSIPITHVYLFTIKLNTLQGKITSWSEIRHIGNSPCSHYFRGYTGVDLDRGPSAGAYKLQDGTWAITNVSHSTEVAGDIQYLLSCLIYKPRDKTFVHRKHSTHSLSTPANYIGTKELGYGVVEPSMSGESCYLKSYGFTQEDVIAGRETTYTLVMSRTDAGDNVTISQYGATKAKEKLTSLIPPTRKVNNMDLRADRIVTTLMVGGDRVPNQRDTTYPVQPKHRDSVVRLSVKDHTHQESSFTMAPATTVAYGGSVLGSIDSADATAFRVDGLTNLNQQLDTLNGRPSELVKLDPTVNVDYEV